MNPEQLYVTQYVVRSSGSPNPKLPRGVIVSDVPLAVIKKYASSKPIFRPAPRRLSKIARPPEQGNEAESA